MPEISASETILLAPPAIRSLVPWASFRAQVLQAAPVVPQDPTSLGRVHPALVQRAQAAKPLHLQLAHRALRAAQSIALLGNTAVLGHHALLVMQGPTAPVEATE